MTAFNDDQKRLILALLANPQVCALLQTANDKAVAASIQSQLVKKDEGG